MTEVLRVKDVTKTYRVGKEQFHALHHIEFTVNKGEFVGVMGPSGAGKSTLLNVIATIDRPTTGTIHIDNKDVAAMNDRQLADFRRDHLGFIFQDYNLLDSLTVRENIVLPLAIAKKGGQKLNDRVEEVAQLFGIEPLLEKYPYEISGGQKQRTAAARALVTHPTMLFADEPTGALDTKSARGLLESLQKLNEEKQSTILMVTHDAFAASFCSRILFIQDGRLSKELWKGDQTRKQFFQMILHELGGDMHDIV